MTLLATYDKIYSRTNSDFKSLLSSFVEDILSYKNKGIAADIGVGRGQNTLFLSENGFSVDALDFSSECIKRLCEIKLKDSQITPQVFDIKNTKLKKKYDIILCNFTLHHFDKKERDIFFEHIKKQTKKGGIHLITGFAEDLRSSHVPQNDVKVSYFQENELENIYSKWDILKFKKELNATEDAKSGKKEIYVFDAILVRKK